MLSGTEREQLPPGDASRFATAAVVGAGLMGRRIAGVLAAGGLAVSVTDVRADLLDSAVADAASVAGEGGAAVTASASLSEAVAQADLVIEAVVEDLDVKRRLFADLALHAPEHAILASNSSVLPITEISREVARGERTVGMHWWNPPDLIPVVEVVQGERTDARVVADVMAVMTRLGKHPVWVRRDTPGFIGNRLQHALWREAIALVAEGVADPATVDDVVRHTIGLRLARMGPLENADYVGLDLTRAIHEAVFPALSSVTAPHAVLDDLLAAGHLGAKSGQGFLTWPPGAREAAAASLAEHVSRQLRDSTT